MAHLITVANKLTFSHPLHIQILHQYINLLNTDDYHFLTNSCITQYQTLFLNHPFLTLSTCMVVNPGTLLPDLQHSSLEHSSIEVLEHSTTIHTDLSDSPLSLPDHNWLIDRSSYVLDGQRKAGYIIVTTAHTKLTAFHYHPIPWIKKLS